MDQQDEINFSLLWRIYHSASDGVHVGARSGHEAQAPPRLENASHAQKRLALHGLLTKRWTSRADCRALCDVLGLDESAGRHYIVLDVCMDGYENLFLRYSLDGIQHIREELLNRCERIFGHVTGVYVADDLMAILLTRDDFLFTDELSEALDELRAWTQQEYGLNLTVGIGTHALSVEELPQSQRNAMIATCYRMVFGSGQNIEYEHIRMRVGVSLPYPGGIEHDILDSVRKGDSSRFERKLSDFYEVVCSASYQFIIMSSVTLLSAIYRQLDEEMQGSCDIIQYQTQLNGCTYWAEQMRVLRAFGLSVMPQAQEKLSSRSDEYATSAIAYIQGNYANPDLSLVSIAEHVGVSQNTIRLVVRDKIGMAPRDFILQVRMEEACRLLMETDMTARDISEQVGYKESRYFYNVFKRYTGLTAFEYRTKKRD